MQSPHQPEIRDYRPPDAASWLRCRVLSFLDSAYYDDVKTARTTFDSEAVRLVAVHPRPAGVTTPGPDEVIGILDVELSDADQNEPDEGGDARTATIDTIAVHPDHQRRGIADRLLAEALTRLAGLDGAPVATLDAWTRDDGAANGWYHRNGFTVAHEYLHVYRAWDESDEGFHTPAELSAPVSLFAHADLADEEAVRGRFARVYRCRQYLRSLGGR